MSTDEGSCDVWTEDCFDNFDFENKLIEILEELRLKRKLEAENEKSIKSLLEIKYDLERIIEKERREHNQQLEQRDKEIDNLKKKFEDFICQAEDEKSNRDHVAKMWEKEICCLRDELKAIHAGKLNAERQLVGLEAKLKLHTNFQETAMKKFNKTKQEAKELMDHQNELLKAQDVLRNNVEKTYSLFDQCNLVNKHLMEKLQEMEKNKAFLTSELVAARSQAKVTNAVPINGEMAWAKGTDSKKESASTDNVVNKLYDQLQKDHQELLKNFLELNKLFNDHVQKSQDYKKKESEALKQLETISLEVFNLKSLLEKAESELKYVKEENENLRIKIEEKLVKDIDIQVNFNDML